MANVFLDEVDEQQQDAVQPVATQQTQGKNVFLDEVDDAGSFGGNVFLDEVDQPPGPRQLTREERIAQNNAAIARAQQPGGGEGGSFGEAVAEGLRGAGRAAKAIGKGFVGLASGAARLAGTPIRAVSGWDGLHRLADSIDSGYDNWGADTLASEYGFDQDTNMGTIGEKIAGLSGTLGSLATGGAVANAAKLPMVVRAGGVALQKSLPWMFGNDAAVRTYDTAKQTAEANGEDFNRARALGLASVNGAIHYFGFKLFENQSLNRMLGMPQAAELAMPGFADAAREGGAKTFSGIVDGVRNGLVKHVVAERAKGALKAGGIMGVQNFLSSLPQQAAEGRDIDWYEALKTGAEGIGEGAFMEGLMGGAAILRSRAAARKFTADKYFREGYRASNGEHVPGLLHTPEGRQFVMKQSPAEQQRILDIVSHGGKVSGAELDAACLPPDMKPDELKEFAKDWRKDLADEWDRAAESEALGDNEELEGNDDVIPREQQMRNRAKVNEARDHERRLAEAEEAQRIAAEEQAADDAAVAAEEAKYREANERADAERQAEAEGAEQLAREEAYRLTEAPQEPAGARGAEGAADVPPTSPDAPQGAEAALEGAQAEPPPEVVDRPNRLRRQQPNNFRHPGDNRLRPAVPDINQQPIRETNDETGNGADEAPAQPVAQVSGRDGRQPPPEAGARPLEGAAARAEAPDAGVVEPISAKKMRAMNYENVIALPDSWRKYSELQSRLMRTGDKGGVSVESPAGKQIKAEMERMDADGWGELYRAHMKWAGTDRKTRGEQPPDTLEAFKEWQTTKSSAPTVSTESKPETKRGENLRGYSYEDYGAPPDVTRPGAGGTGDQMGAELLRFARDNGGILKIPPKGAPDPLADWIANFKDGGGRGDHIALFGMRPRKGTNDGITEDMPSPLKEYVEGMIERDGSEAVADWFLETRRKYAEWAAGRRGAAREAREAAKVRAEEDAIYDYEGMSAARDGADAEWDGAIGEIEAGDPMFGATSEYVKPFSRENLRNAKQGDIIHFDHDKHSFALDAYDDAKGEVTLIDERDGVRRRFKVSKNGIREIGDGRRNEEVVDKDNAGDAGGGRRSAAGAPGEAAGGERGGGEDFALESATAEELKAEKERQRQRDEVRRRQEAPMETGTGEVGQTLLDLGGAEGGDLFNQTQRTETNRLRNAAGEDPLAASGQGARKEGSATAAPSAGNAAPKRYRVNSQTFTEIEESQPFSDVNLPTAARMFAGASEKTIAGSIEIAKKQAKVDGTAKLLYLPRSYTKRRVSFQIEDVGKSSPIDWGSGRLLGGETAPVLLVKPDGNVSFVKIAERHFDRVRGIAEQNGFEFGLEGYSREIGGKDFELVANRKNGRAELSYTDGEDADGMPVRKRISTDKEDASAAIKDLMAKAENVASQATSKNDADTSNSDVAARATWTDRGGTTHVLEGFDAPSSDNVAKGAHVAVRHDNGVLYQGEIVGIGPKNVKVKTQSDMYGETVLTFPRKDIVGVKSQAGQAQQNTERTEDNDVAALTAKAQALAKEYAALPDVEKVSRKGRDLEQRIAEAWDAVDAAERAENAPVAAPKKTGATTPPEATKPAEGGKSASGATPAAPTPEMRRKATAAMRILGADAGKDADALEAELRRMEERGQAASGPGRRRADALRDLAAYKRAVGTKEVSAEEITEGRRRDAEQRIIEGKGDTLPSEDFYGRRQSRGNGEMPAKWTDAAKKPLERVARALRNVVTVGGKKLKVSFADRPADVNDQTRKSIGGVFTGTAADYASRSRQGGVDDGPSVKHIGTGEGSQVYGWGLYGSTVRGVAEGYAGVGETLYRNKNTGEIRSLEFGPKYKPMAMGDYDYYSGNVTPEAAKKGWERISGQEHLYEQTFFTDRAPGDESHLLKWYEDLPKEQVEWIAQEFAKEGFFVASFSKLKGWTILDRTSGKKMSLWDKRESGETYEAIAKFLGSPQAASEFLARAGIDGVKYPVDSYGAKTVKDGDKAGWNYVAFSDEHIRVDHKWTDGELRYMRNGDGEVVGEYDADKGEIRLYPGATVADVVHEFTHPLVDFARAEAKAGRGEFLGKIKEIIDAERATWEEPVRDAYADKGEGEILEEIFTHAMGEKGATLFGKSTTTLEGRRWYNRLWEAIKGVWQDFATKMGWNKADLSGLDGMSPEDAAQRILSEMAKGRSFGDAVTGGEGTRESRRVTPPGGNGGGATLFSSTSPVDVNEKETFVQKVQRKLQDYRAVIKRTEEKLGITDKGRSLYYALDRVFGKTRDEAHRLAKGKVEPMLRKLVEAGAAMGKRFDATNGAEVGLDDYLYAMHAKERNDVLASRPDARVSVDGSGMSEAKAQSILSAFAAMPEAKRRAIEDAAQTVWDINDSRLDRLVESGRMSQDEADGLRRTYRHYVPLRTDMEAMGEDLFNTGTSGWAKSEFRRALGRTTEADSPTVFSLMQAEDAIAGANKNEARQRLYDMVTAHPELGRIRKMDKLTRKWSYTHGEEALVADERYNERDRDDIVMVKRGGTLYAIELDGALGKRLAAAVTSRNLARFPDELSIIPKATRTMAEMRTQLVPTFLLRNMKADHLEVFLNSIGDMGFMGASRFLGRTERHFVSADAHKAIQQYFTTGRVDTSTDAGRLFDEYVKTGSLIGGGNRQGYADTATELNDIIDDMVRGKANPRRWGKAAKECVSTLNEHIETGTRFGVYWTCREMGMSPEEAASYSRDLTTNFNRKGEWTPVTNSLFMFSNAAIQGLARASKSMNPKMSKNAYQSLMTIGAIGVLGALWRHFLGSDDERRRKGEGDPSFDTDYDKANYIRFGWGGTSLSLKERYPWAAVKYAAEKLTEFALGDCTRGDLAKGLGENVVEAMLQEPFGHGGTAAQTVTPSVFVPITQMLEGKDFRGEDMYARKFNESEPDSSNGKRSTSGVYKGIAQGLNWLTGGNAYRQGGIDLAPETVKTVAETIGGGVWTDATRVATLLERAYDSMKSGRNEFELRDIPFLGDAVKKHRGPEAKYYEAIEAYDRDKYELKNTKDANVRRELRKDKPYLHTGKSLLDGLIERVKELGHLERGEVKAGQKWVERKTPLPEERKRRFREQRLATQARVLKMLGE